MVEAMRVDIHVVAVHRLVGPGRVTASRGAEPATA
jgi:hypothetical protein